MLREKASETILMAAAMVRCLISLGVECGAVCVADSVRKAAMNPMAAASPGSVGAPLEMKVGLAS